MVTAAGAKRAAAVDKGRGPVGPSLADLAIGSPVAYPPVQAPRASDVRAGYLGLGIAPVNKQYCNIAERVALLYEARAVRTPKALQLGMERR